MDMQKPDPKVRTFVFQGLLAQELPTDRRTVAESEVTSITGVLERIASELGLERNVELDIVLASDIAPHVNAARQRFGKLDALPYNPKGVSGQAEGIAVFGGGPGPVRGSIILQHDRWLTDDQQAVTLRWFFLFHELMHVIQRAQGDGANHEEFDETTCTYSENVTYQAHVAYDEYDADRRADKLCRQFLPAAGINIGASEFLLDGYTGSVTTLLETMGEFVRSEVLPYRANGGNFESLAFRAHRLLRELFRVLAHATALADAVDSIEGLTNAMAPLEGFSTYLEPDWTTFVGAMHSASGADAETDLSTVWSDVMERLGFIIENTEDGQLYIHVVEPLIP